MKILKPILTLFFFFGFYKIQAQPIVFSISSFYTSTPSTANCLLQLPDHGYLVGGNGAVIKVDSAGDLVWHTKIDAGILAGCNTKDSGSFFVGYAGVVIKLNSMGDTLWCNSILMGNPPNLISVVETFDKGFAICGYLDSFPSPEKIIIVKLDSVGNLKWACKINTGSLNHRSSAEIHQAPDSSLLISGTNPACLFSLTSNGIFAWAKEFSGINYFNDFEIISDGILCCLTKSSGIHNVIKTDMNGNTLWANRYQLSYSGGKKIQAMAGNRFAFHSGNILIVSDSTGNILQKKQIPTGISDFTSCYDNGFCIIGTGIYDASSFFGMIKTDSLLNGPCVLNAPSVSVNSDTVYGTSSTYTVTYGGSSFKQAFYVDPYPFNLDTVCLGYYAGISENNYEEEIKIFPNPSEGKIKISAQKEIRSLIVYDGRGQQFFLKEEGNKAKNEIDLSFLPDGFYFLKITTINSVLTEKILIAHP